jgi:two-component system sensor histidine kinase QseC
MVDYLAPSGSIRRRLLIALLGAIFVIWGIAAVLSIADTHSEVDELFDANLAQSAKVLLAQAAHEIREGHSLEEIQVEESEVGHKYEQKIAFQIWNDKGALLQRSTSAPFAPMAEQGEGFSDPVIAGEQWRVFSMWNGSREFQIQVGERHDVREELTSDVAENLIAPFLVALPLLAILIWVGVGRGLSPIERISGEVAERAPHLLAPIDTSAVPAEILPLVRSLNSLFGRLQQAFERERHFTADAAHELRTPLAALKTQAQVALRGQTDEERQAAVERVIQGVNRTTRLVEQLLTLARLDPEQCVFEGARVDLRSVAVATLGELAADAIAKDIDLSLEPGVPCVIKGNTTMLEVLLRNLVDNAIRYSSAGGRVAVEVLEEDARAVLQVTDSGPGITPQERERIFERFYRGQNVEASGSGLGLSIVQRIAELHHARIALGAPETGTGLRVRVSLPR